MAKTIGILTGGGDCPGLNAVIRAVVRSSDAAGWDCVAVLEGWHGLVDGRFEDLGPREVSGPDSTSGFDTAVTIATEAIDRLHTTAESHNRVMVVEVMGRHAGWIAVVSGIAGGADVILIPEQPMTVEAACEELRRRHARGKNFSIVVVSEGYELT